MAHLLRPCRQKKCCACKENWWKFEVFWIFKVNWWTLILTFTGRNRIWQGRRTIWRISSQHPDTLDFFVLIVFMLISWCLCACMNTSIYRSTILLLLSFNYPPSCIVLSHILCLLLLFVNQSSWKSFFEIISKSLDINPRIRVLNQRLDYASKVVELIQDYLNKRHGTRMEWIIIVLIAVEVVFEVVHYLNELRWIDLQASLGNPTMFHSSK